jgi:hypothetical protein
MEKNMTNVMTFVAVALQCGTYIHTRTKIRAVAAALLGSLGWLPLSSAASAAPFLRRAEQKHLQPIRLPHQRTIAGYTRRCCE